MAKHWMSKLEGKVEAAVAEITELRKKNRSLQRQIEKLRRELSQGGPADADLWERQRAEIRERIAKLAERLERIA